MPVFHVKTFQESVESAPGDAGRAKAGYKQRLNGKNGKLGSRRLTCLTRTNLP